MSYSKNLCRETSNSRTKITVSTDSRFRIAVRGLEMNWKNGPSITRPFAPTIEDDQYATENEAIQAAETLVSGYIGEGFHEC
jgi:hypothetical protein